MAPRDGSTRVLLVLRDVASREAVLRELAGSLDVRAIDSIDEAMRVLEQERFELMLVDHSLVEGAEGDGLELLARARRVQPGARRVLVAPPSQAADFLAAIDSGDVFRVLAPPLDRDVIVACLEDRVRDTLPQADLCVVIDQDVERGARIAQSLIDTGELGALPRPHLEARPLPAVALLVEPASPQVVEDAIRVLGGASRRAAVMAILSPLARADAAALVSAGADDVLWMPLRAEEVLWRLDTWRTRRDAQAEAERLRSELLQGLPFPAIVGRSEPMRRLFAMVHRVAPTDSTVLVSGETGTGKELLARTLHALSHRRDRPFHALNLAALPESLVEAELFGHEPGAFTGATQTRAGRIEAVAGGTLFLDEIGDLALSVQVKLLRVLEDRQFQRLGSSQSRKADFRLLCATHRNLEQRVAEGLFREDLYYRINVVRLDLPPLRERPGDARLLAHHFLEHFRKRAKLGLLSLSDEALDTIDHHDWPGNVRELEHVLERAVAVAQGPVIGPELLWARPARRSFRRDMSDFFESGRGLREVLLDIERTIIADTLQRYGGNQGAAAKKLRIPRQTLQHRLRKLGI